MSRRCELTGVSPMSGNRVSKSNRKVRRRFLPNLVRVSLESESLGSRVPVRLTQRAWRTVEKAGGLDRFLLESGGARGVSGKLKRLRRVLMRRCGAPAGSSAALGGRAPADGCPAAVDEVEGKEVE